MSNFNVDLPDSLQQTIQALARQNGVSVEQFIVTAVTGKISAVESESYLEELARRGNRAKYDAVLAKVPDVEPDTCDQLPTAENTSKDSKSRLLLPGFSKIINGSLPEDLNKINSVILSISKIFFAIGTPSAIFLLFSYCQKISYFPTDLSAGDILKLILILSVFSILSSFFIFISISISDLVAEIILMLFSATKNLFRFLLFLISSRSRSLRIARLLRTVVRAFKANFVNKSKGVIFFSYNFLISFTGIVVIAVLWIEVRNFALILIFLIALLTLLLLYYKYASKYVPRNKASREGFYLFLFMVSILFILLFYGIPAPILNLSMKSIGILQEDVVVLIPEQQYKAIESLSSNKIDSPITYNESKGKVLVPNSCILFEGIGDKTFVQFNTSKGSVRSIVSSKDLIIYKSHLKKIPNRKNQYLNMTENCGI